ncbi:hypothetical protein [Vaginisenegalia massiliensis]|uniref:hypothetical protein n=1 Tax=Vaginisenegalia massiliensis TaxID=2058294 RepID=UPI000F527A6F|nr:hypothetical protein [Vaginisenegalia massiliensis]
MEMHYIALFFMGIVSYFSSGYIFIWNSNETFQIMFNRYLQCMFFYQLINVLAVQINKHIFLYSCLNLEESLNAIEFQLSNELVTTEFFISAFFDEVVQNDGILLHPSHKRIMEKLKFSKNKSEKEEVIRSARSSIKYQRDKLNTLWLGGILFNPLRNIGNEKEDIQSLFYNFQNQSSCNEVKTE